jgi:hypothetical protein
MQSPIEDFWTYLRTNYQSGITVSGCTSHTGANGIYVTNSLIPLGFYHSIENTYTIVYPVAPAVKYQLKSGSTILAESTTLIGTWTNKTGITGTIKTVKSPCWWGIKQGDDNQMVVMGRGVGDPIISTYKSYFIDIHVHDINFRGAEDRALSLATALGSLKGTQTGAPGWTGSAWTAVQIAVDYRGVIEATKITGGQLYDAVVSINLTQLRSN